MAAVLCLVFLPLTASLGFMIGATMGDGMFGSIVGALMFLAIAAGILFGTMSLARGWDHEGEH